MIGKEPGQVFLNLEARLFLDHIRITKRVPVRKAKTHVITIPVMAPEFNDDDLEKDLVFCDKGTEEDVGGDKVEENEDTDEGDIEEVEVDIRDVRDFISLVVTIVVDDELLAWKDVECEGVDVETSGRISTTVTVTGDISLVPDPLLPTMSFKTGALK